MDDTRRGTHFPSNGDDGRPSRQSSVDGQQSIRSLVESTSLGGVGSVREGRSRRVWGTIVSESVESGCTLLSLPGKTEVLKGA